MQCKLLGYEFKPTLLGTLITLACIPLFIKLGLWQYNKAMLKQNIQNSYLKSSTNGSLELIQHLKDAEKLQYQKVKVAGTYDTRYQILIDNQVENERAGFHVVTPLKIQNTDTYVLVNRGWILGKDRHAEVPKFDTPVQTQDVEGMIWMPSKKIFTLEEQSEKAANAPWQQVWQNLDIAKYQKIAPIKILPVIIKLDPSSNAGGFVRNWRMSTERIMKNLSYAYQWFGFSFAAVAIYFYLSIKRINTNE